MNSTTRTVDPMRKPSPRSFAVIAAAGLLTVMMAAPVQAMGPDPDRLANAGWFCFGHGAPALHCLPDGDAVFAAEAKTSIILTWGADGDFWGTELLVRDDIYNGQPCPQDLVNGQRTTYIPVSDLGLDLPYFVCHHFESPLT